MPKRISAKNKFRTQWNLGLLFDGPDDPKIEKETAAAEAAYADFEKKYGADESFVKSEDGLLESLRAFEALQNKHLGKAYLYFHYLHDSDSKNAKAAARQNLFAERYAKSANRTAFFRVALTKIPEEARERYLKSKKLEPYKFVLVQAFREAPHTLSAPEEKLLNIMRLPSHELWIRATEKMLSQETVKFGGRSVPLSEAMFLGKTLPTKGRRALHRETVARLKANSSIAESELNAVVIGKKLEDEIRRFEKPYDATVIGYQNDTETVENLVKVVTERFDISRRFYRLKAKMMGLKSIEYADRSAPVGKVGKKIPFAKAVEIVRLAFGKFGSVYSETFESFLKRGQIDVFPRKGKASGAYCSSYEDLPTFVLLNHVDDFSSVTTMAHEMGHAIHSKLSTENQPPLFRDYSYASAETASTLFENFAFEEILPELGEREKIVALHDRISSSVQTIFRQIACFNFEKELHAEIRKRGALPKEEIAKLMNKHMGAYLGASVKLRPDDGYFFVYWSHIRRFFYVYSYAFGELVSNALYEKYTADRKFEAKIKSFLSAGGSASPEDIFASIGVDIRKPDFFRKGLEKIEKDIERLERLIN